MKIKQLLFTASFILAGCSSIQNPQQRAGQVYSLSRGASAFAVSSDLQFNEKHRVLYSQSWTNLDTQLSFGTLDANRLRNIISGLPVDQLKSPEAVLAVNGAVFLFDTVTAGSVNVESNFVYVTAAGRGVHDGIGSVLHLGTQLGPP